MDLMGITQRKSVLRVTKIWGQGGGVGAVIYIIIAWHVCPTYPTRF